MKLKKCIALLLVGMAVLSGCGKGETVADNIGNSDGNISNLGSVCEKNGTLYYQNDKDNFAVYKTVKGGEDVKLNDAPSYFINVVGDYVYYVNENSDFHIFRMKTDGSDNQEIVNQAAYYMTVYNDKIYYANYDDAQKIYVSNIDGSDNHKIVDATCYYPIVAQDSIFYVDYSNKGRVTMASLDGTSPKVLDESNPITAAYLNYDNGILYYTNAVDRSKNNAENKEEVPFDNYIMSYDLEKGVTNTVLEEPCADVNVYDGRIYFSSLTDNKVYSVDLKGNDKEEVYDYNGIFINVSKDKVHCYVKLVGQDPYIERVDR